jgi:hypothetical protein
MELGGAWGVRKDAAAVNEVRLTVMTLLPRPEKKTTIQSRGCQFDGFGSGLLTYSGSRKTLKR